MICPVCGGTGDHPATRDEHGQPLPCCECGGCGITHCCEGECAQPEPEDKRDD